VSVVFFGGEAKRAGKASKELLLMMVLIYQQNECGGIRFRL
jgi:hypothetical protein